LGHVQERRPGAVEHVEPLGRRGHQHERDRRHQEGRGGGREQAPEAPGVEPPQRDPTHAGVLLEHDAGDQEPRQHEEEVDADEAALEHGQPAVEQHHQVDGEHPHPVEGGHVPPPGAGGVRRRALLQPRLVDDG